MPRWSASTPAPMRRRPVPAPCRTTAPDQLGLQISGAEALRHPVNPQMFHLRASYGDETAAIVKNLITVGVRRVAVFYQDDGFGQAGLKGVKDALTANKLEPVAVASVPRNSVDVAAAAAAIAKADAQAVVMVTLYRPTAEFIKQLRRAKANPFFVALSPVGTDQLPPTRSTRPCRATAWRAT